MDFPVSLVANETFPDTGWPVTAGSLNSELNYVVTSGSMNTKGSWYEAIAALPRDCSGLIVGHFLLDTTGVVQVLMDVAIGPAGSEVIVAENLAFSTRTTSTVSHTPNVRLPIALPRGTRVSLRAQRSEVSSTNTRWTVWPYYDAHIPSGNVIETYGANTATSKGVVVTAGASGAYGSWYEIAGALRRPAKALMLSFGNNGNSSTAGYWLLQLGRGVAGSERAVYAVSCACTGWGFVSPEWHHIPIQLPKNERVAVRGAFQATSTDGKDRSIVLYTVS